MKIYTKKGDQGRTTVYRSGTITKASNRMAAIGDVDELNCHIGVIVALLENEQSIGILQKIQNDLFDIGADLATVSSGDDKQGKNRFEAGLESSLEKQIDDMDCELAPLTNFILPGGSQSGAAVHLARAVCRRAERTVVGLAEDERLNPAIIVYLNRLSDFLFTLSRYQNKFEDSDEILWKNAGSK